MYALTTRRQSRSIARQSRRVIGRINFCRQPGGLRGVYRCGKRVERSGAVWCGPVWSRMVPCGLLWSGVMWCGPMWSGKRPVWFKRGLLPPRVQCGSGEVRSLPESGVVPARSVHSLSPVWFRRGPLPPRVRCSDSPQWSEAADPRSGQGQVTRAVAGGRPHTGDTYSAGGTEAELPLKHQRRHRLEKETTLVKTIDNTSVLKTTTLVNEGQGNDQGKRRLSPKNKPSLSRESKANNITGTQSLGLQGH